MQYFFEQMKELLGSQYTDFKNAYDNKPRHKALRINTLKVAPEFFSAYYASQLTANSLCPQSFYCDVKPSIDPLYHAGLYYMQEPSASAAVSAFAPLIGRRVLDLCAAPGGKSTQTAAFLDRDAVMFCNDVEYKRVRALVENIERLGVSNAVVTCNTAADYRAAGFDGYFDTLIVDAPCSGGGMMRYETVPYSHDIVLGCAARQRKILEDAAMLVSNGGHILYSTCTFSREENEDNVEYLISLGFKPIDVPLREGEVRGFIPEARRIYPHNFDGEGHFYCILEKTGGGNNDRSPARKKRGTVNINGYALPTAEIFGNAVLPIELPELKGLNVIRVGTPVLDGKLPSHALSHALTVDEYGKVGAVELADLAERYICGEQLDITAPRGIVLATVEGFALGWARSATTGDGADALKNLYPKHLRK